MATKLIFPAIVALGFAVSGAAQAQSAATTATPPSVSGTRSPTATAPSTTGPNSATSGAPVVSGTSSATNNAVSTAPANNAGAPVAGANSFTEGQARDRIGAKGYSQITNLALDKQGIWRGKGMKDGKSVDVSMDYQGNVVPQ